MKSSWPATVPWNSLAKDYLLFLALPSEEDCPRKLAFLALHAVSELDGFGFHDVLI